MFVLAGAHGTALFKLTAGKLLPFYQRYCTDLYRNKKPKSTKPASILHYAINLSACTVLQTAFIRFFSLNVIRENDKKLFWLSWKVLIKIIKITARETDQMYSLADKLLKFIDFLWHKSVFSIFRDNQTKFEIKRFGVFW